MILGRRLAAVLAPALLAPLAVGVAWRLPGRAALSILATVAIAPFFARLLLAERRAAAVAAALLWAGSFSATIIAVTARDPVRAGERVLLGPPYRDEMFAFIRAGEGRESDPRRFVPQQLLHTAGFAIATLASAGVLGLAMGAVLVGYMSYYVGALAAGPAPWTAALFGWPPWAMVRVVAFVLLGAVLSRPLLARLAHRPRAARSDRPLIVAAVALLILDLLLKATFATTWAALLRPCLGP